MKPILKLLIFLFLIILFFPIKISAASSFWSGDPPNREIRLEQAKEWLICLKKLEEQIPTLSPAEKQWIEVEFDKEVAKGVYTNRALNAMGSKEFNVRLARSHIETVNLILKQLANAHHIPKNKEVILWANLSNYFMDENFWNSILVLIQQNIIDDKICGLDQKELYHSNFVLWSQGIINRVIINYLNDKLP